MTRRFLTVLLAAPLALAACGDADDLPTEPVATSSQMPPAASDVDGVHEMSDGTVMAGDEHEHVTTADGDAVAPEVTDGVQTVQIEAGRMGYQPRQVALEAGVPARLVFTRTVEDECSSRITIPAYNVERDLPLGEPVAVEFTPTEAGELEFVCGMDMQRGTIAVVS